MGWRNVRSILGAAALLTQAGCSGSGEQQTAKSASRLNENNGLVQLNIGETSRQLPKVIPDSIWNDPSGTCGKKPEPNLIQKEVAPGANEIVNGYIRNKTITSEYYRVAITLRRVLDCPWKTKFTNGVKNFEPKFQANWFHFGVWASKNAGKLMYEDDSRWEIPVLKTLTSIKNPNELFFLNWVVDRELATVFSFWAATIPAMLEPKIFDNLLSDNDVWRQYEREMMGRAPSERVFSFADALLFRTRVYLARGNWEIAEAVFPHGWKFISHLAKECASWHETENGQNATEDIIPPPLSAEFRGYLNELAGGDLGNGWLDDKGMPTSDAIDLAWERAESRAAAINADRTARRTDAPLAIALAMYRASMFADDLAERKQYLWVANVFFGVHEQMIVQYSLRKALNFYTDDSSQWIKRILQSLMMQGEFPSDFTSTLVPGFTVNMDPVVDTIQWIESPGIANFNLTSPLPFEFQVGYRKDRQPQKWGGLWYLLVQRGPLGNSGFVKNVLDNQYPGGFAWDDYGKRLQWLAGFFRGLQHAENLEAAPYGNDTVSVTGENKPWECIACPKPRPVCVEDANVIAVTGGHAYKRRVLMAGSLTPDTGPIVMNANNNCSNACYAVGTTGVIWAHRFDPGVNAVRISNIDSEANCKLPDQVKMDVALVGEGLGTVSLRNQATFDRSAPSQAPSSVCDKDQNDTKKCITTVSAPGIDPKSQNFVFSALPNRRFFTATAKPGSYLVGWRFQNSLGSSMAALQSKCQGKVTTCDLGGVAIPRGTTMQVLFAKPVYLTVALVKGGTVRNEESGARFNPGNTQFCSRRDCTILVSDGSGEKNRLFVASRGGVSGGPFLGWTLMDETGATVRGCRERGSDYVVYCDLTSVTIGRGWKLQAVWRDSPGGTVELKIRHEKGGYTNDNVAYVYLPPQYNDGQTWESGDLNRLYSDPIKNGKTNHSHDRSKYLLIQPNTDFSSNLTSIDAAPVGRCGRPVFTKWEIERSTDNFGRPIGPDLSSRCGSAATCWLGDLARVTKWEEFPRSITAVFSRGPACPPQHNGGSTGSTTGTTTGTAAGGPASSGSGSTGTTTPGSSPTGITAACFAKITASAACPAGYEARAGGLCCAIASAPAPLP
jgi:hypothetical protein